MEQNISFRNGGASTVFWKYSRAMSSNMSLASAILAWISFILSVSLDNGPCYPDRMFLGFSSRSLLDLNMLAGALLSFVALVSGPLTLIPAMVRRSRDKMAVGAVAIV